MRLRILLCIFLLCSSLLFARIPKTRSRTLDPLYSSALAAANHFLYAWQSQDHETGIMMLSDAARQRASREQLQQFFSPGDQAAFEILHGKRLRPGEYMFPVVLFGFSGPGTRPRVSKLVISKAGSDWAIERLP